MIGLGPHEMTTGLWVSVAVLQLGLIALTAVVIWFAVRVTKGFR